MKDLFLIPITLAVFALLSFMMRRLDRLLAENRRRLAAQRRSGRGPVHMAAEHGLHLEPILAALESCAQAEPSVTYSLQRGRAKSLLKKLLAEQVDILLLSEEQAAQLDRRCASLLIPCDNAKEAAPIAVVWKKGYSSRSRDYILVALENAHCSLKSPYADYLEPSLAAAVEKPADL